MSTQGVIVVFAKEMYDEPKMGGSIMGDLECRR